MQINWEEFRDPDRSINLTAAFYWYLSENPRLIDGNFCNIGAEYIRNVCELQKIRSRQAAAIAIATAVELSRQAAIAVRR